MKEGYMHHWLTEQALKMVWLPAMADFAACWSTARLSLEDEEGAAVLSVE